MGATAAQQWQRITDEWARSGLSKYEFAAQRGVNPRTLEWWRWKLNGRGRQGDRSGSRAERQAFVEVVVEHDESRAIGAPSLELCPAFLVEVGHVRVHVPRGFDEGELRRLVEALC